MTSAMASLDSSMPPSTDCSASMLCGGVRSNVESEPPGPPGKSSTLTLTPPAQRSQHPQPGPQVSPTSGTGGKLTSGQPCGQHVQSAPRTCENPGDDPVDSDVTTSAKAAPTWDFDIHGLWRKESHRRFPIPIEHGPVSRKIVLCHLPPRRDTAVPTTGRSSGSRSRHS